MSLSEIKQIQFDTYNMLDEYKTRPLTPKSIFLINANHYIVGAVGSGKTTLMSKLIVLYKHIINPYILYFSNMGPDESMSLNMNDKNIAINNITYDDAMMFLPQFDEIKYKVKELYTYWKLKQMNIKYNSDYIKQSKQNMIDANELKKDETYQQFTSRMKEQFKTYCIETINEYSQPTKLMQYTIPPLVQHVSYEKRLKIIDTEEIDEDGISIIKTLKLPILQNARLLSSLMIFDDIGSNTDIQRYTSQLARTITHLVSDSRHSKNTLFFVAQRPSYLFKTARILCHVIVIGTGISDNDIKQIYDENHFNTLNEEELIVLYNTLRQYELIIINKYENRFEILRKDL
ncbi:MAG: hypothetical protein EZS28_046266 [Streblomastix strix]|uniref:Uncharacterized protein n=1 Tax=Streblomastix strix TaxID=222440 RepID=A0A5J4TIX0_9EUKA|nr:MAG: hypothetical protein EZS28_046266 [Streblomastix strix]